MTHHNHFAREDSPCGPLAARFQKLLFSAAYGLDKHVLLHLFVFAFAASLGREW